MEKELVTIAKEEYDYLVWFRTNVDLGPAHGYVLLGMHEDYEADGNSIPDVWSYE